MTTVDIRRVQFLLQQTTQAEVSRETGIPSSTLSYGSRGLRDVPSSYTNDLRNYYQRQAYERARVAGVNVTSARRISWTSPENVTMKIAQFNDKVLSFTEGVAAGRIEAYENEFGKATQPVIDSIFAESYTSVVEGLRKSPVPIEDIISGDYP